MRIALVAPPFIPVPPRNYGGTELFIGKLAQGLQRQKHEVVLYTNGESTAACEKRWIYSKSQWPIKGEIFDNLKDLNHTAWAIRDAADWCDVIHLNNAPGLVCSRFVKKPFVYTVHHPHIPGLSDFYANYSNVGFVAISDFQRRKENMPGMRTIHHGIDLRDYPLKNTGDRGYLCFLGRIAPIKGTHLAIAAAQRSGIPIKIAGEVQPMYRQYFEQEIKPHIDGKQVEYVGEVGLEAKVEFLNGARALLFPIEWEEPFGLVMVEAMACGAPVLGFPRGAVNEIVKEGITGHLCSSVEEMAARAKELHFAPHSIRKDVEANFSVEKMTANYERLYGDMISGNRKDREPATPERSVA